ncbi:MAG: hypothetical protein Q7T19_02445, partial [Caulobacter sp.]|nr:hypothetical protein [Caulobacter sp.]
RDVLAQLPLLRMIAVTATGYNVVDVAAARMTAAVRIRMGRLPFPVLNWKPSCAHGSRAANYNAEIIL